MSPVDIQIRRGESGYPRRLAAIPDGPTSLYVAGSWEERPVAVAIVGSRGASREGVERVRRLAAELGERGVQIVSGGALGIDAAAHEGALAAEAHTVAALAHGLDQLYPPRNRPLFEEIERAGGALISPYPRGRPPRGFHFLHRNRMMAGMVDAVVAGECRAGSGAIYTAEAARDLGRAVCALPGSAGAEGLIAQGVGVAESADDVLAAAEGSPRRPDARLPNPESEGGRVLAALGGAPLREDEIAERAGISTRRTTRALAELEVAGLAVLAPGRRYVRSKTAEAAPRGAELR